MKKVFLSLAVVGLIGLASCNKDEYCDCTRTSSSGIENYEQIKEKTDCSDYNETSYQAGSRNEIICKEQD